MTIAPRSVTSYALALALAIPAAALAAEPPTADQLAAQERVRPKIEAIWTEVRTPEPVGAKPNPNYFFEVTDALVALGPDATPFLVAELDLSDSQTFHFAAYALGRLGGPGAEEALRKAVRRADERGGRFGEACKRFALYGLAVLGVPDVVDMVQDGVEIQAANMIADLTLMPNLAMLVAPQGIPHLMRQRDTYAGDPEAAVKLGWAVQGLGRSGDSSVVPKIVPLLSHPAIRVRAAAADAIGRLGDGALCEKLMPLLANARENENRTAAVALARMHPDACVKAITARLEVEPDVEVRTQLYRALGTVEGEAALEVYRLYIGSTDPYEPSNILDAIGRIGSRKGLNLVRAALKSPNGNSLQRGLETLAILGGDGATDTLLAMTGDPRRTVRLLASRNLTEMGVARAGPRIASNLLELTAEPIGDLSFRPTVAEYAEALVTLRTTEPIPDLQKAASRQTDPEIAASLRSCVARLELLVANEADVAKWTASLTGAGAGDDVRRLAAARLAEIGSPEAVAALEARLADRSISPRERAAILRSIGEARTERAAAVVEANLADSAYDTFDMRDARFAAAWAARRIGGDRMVRALRDSAIRRDGRDWATLVYLCVIDPTGSAPTLSAMRARRLRYPEARMGREDDQIEEILHEIVRGVVPRRFDVPPEKLSDL